MRTTDGRSSPSTTLALLQALKVLRTRFVAVVALTALLGTTSGCGESSNDLYGRASSTSQTFLDVAVFDAMGVHPLIREWERAHPGVTVRLQPGNWVAQNEGLLDGFGGTTPDVVTVESAYFAQAFERSDRFLDLSLFGADDLSDAFLPWRWEQGVHRPSGKVLGIPTDAGGLAIAYRVDLFREAGLPTEPDEVAALWPTWESYSAVGREFHESTGVAWLGHPAWLFAGVVHQQPGQFDHSIEAGRFTPGPAIRRAWEIAVDAVDMSADVDPMTPGAFSDTSGANQFATVVAPAWLTTHIKESAPEAQRLWSLAPVPEGHGNWGGSELAIPERAEHPELAWSLISFLSTAASQRKIFEERGNFPSRTDVYKSSTAPQTDPFFSDAPAFTIYSESLERATGVTNTHYDRPIRVAYTKALQLMIDEDLNEYDAWRTAVALTEDAIAKKDG